PTGEVDWPTAQLILKLLRDLRERYGLTIVLVTHDPRVTEWADRGIAIRDGRTSTETIRTTDDRPFDPSTALRGALAQGRQPMTDDRKEEPSVVGGQRSVVEELVVLDKAGHLQLPGDQRALAGIGRRARVDLVDGGILIRPGDDERIGMGVALEASEGNEADDSSYTSPYRAG